MKKAVLILTLCVVSSVSFAKTNHPSIDDDRDFSFKFESSESDRGVANVQEAPKKIPPKSQKTEDIPMVPEIKERDIASDEEIFDKSNDQGIRYWKY
jgi:hypothetical protein